MPSAVPTDRSLVTGTDFVVLWTRDLDAASAFYGEVLGLPCIDRYGTDVGAEFETGNLTLAVMRADAVGREWAPGAPVALAVDDVEAARRTLEARGVAFAGGVDSGACHQAYFADPDGNPLILHHRYAPKRRLA